MTSWSEVERLVQQRAKNRCEYCRMHQLLQGATFHVEHILPRSSGGESQIDNLAWACPSCNLHKSNRLKLTTEDGETVPVFNPRKDSWPDHFDWDGYKIVGKTMIGKTLAVAFEFNSERKINIRKAEGLFELFPPED